MGKAGKARKRQRLERSLAEGVLRGEEVDEEELLETESPVDKSEVTNVPIIECNRTDKDILLEVLAVFVRNREEYRSKKLKVLRQKLFPLLDVQRDKFFEPEPPLAPFSSQKVRETLSIKNIAACIRAVESLVINPALFQAVENKALRKAMHPLVLAQFDIKEKPSKGKLHASHEEDDAAHEGFEQFPHSYISMHDAV